MARPSGRDIRAEVMDRARRAIQSSGTGFSYGDLARQIGVKAPSIHHHFQRKDDLIAATTRQYRSEFRRRVEAIEAVGAVGRLTAYSHLFLGPADDGLLCLCGAVAASWDTVDDAARTEVEAFFSDELAWLTAEIDAGMAGGELRSDLDPDQFAVTLLCALEGALLLARSLADDRDLQTAAAALQLVQLAANPT